MKVFSRLPGRLAFFIRDAVPMSALAAGHIFLGFSKCGQYLLSYTQTTTEGDQFDLVNFNYYYRLHWWLFLPYAKARKVAEVTLFANQVCLCCKHLNTQTFSHPRECMGTCRSSFASGQGITVGWWFWGQPGLSPSHVGAVIFRCPKLMNGKVGGEVKSSGHEMKSNPPWFAARRERTRGRQLVEPGFNIVSSLSPQCPALAIVRTVSG